MINANITPLEPLIINPIKQNINPKMFLVFINLYAYKQMNIENSGTDANIENARTDLFSINILDSLTIDIPEDIHNTS